MIRPDLVSEDRETSRLLVVEVQRNFAESDRAFFMKQLQEYAASLGSPRTVYYILVDNELIQIYRDDVPKPRLLAKLSTSETLEPYIGEKYSGTMSEFLMSGMTMAWLRDLASRWKEKTPPGSELIDADIVDLLTKSGVRLESIP